MRARTGVLTMIFAAAMAAPAAPAMAQSNPCLALPTDAERLICMRDQRAGTDAAGSETGVQATAASVAASTEGRSAADACLALPTDAERLACMRGALAAAESALASQQGADGDDDDGFLGLGILGGGEESAADSLGAAGAVSAAGLGAEQIGGDSYRRPESAESPGSEAEEQRALATVVEFEEHVPGIWQFELDNGQLWRQLSGDPAKIHPTGDDEPVEMWKSWAGGYRMRLMDQERVVTVERVR